MRIFQARSKWVSLLGLLLLGLMLLGPAFSQQTLWQSYIEAGQAKLKEKDYQAAETLYKLALEESRSSQEAIQSAE